MRERERYEGNGRGGGREGHYVYYYYYYYVVVVVSSHRPFLPGTSLEPEVIPTAQASIFKLQYFPYYV